MLQPTLYEPLQILCDWEGIHIVRQELTNISNPIGQHYADATFDDTALTSRKRPKILCCEILNDNFHCAAVAPLSVLPNRTSDTASDDTGDEVLDDMLHDIQILEDDTEENEECPTQHDTIASSAFMFSTDQKWTISLLKILDDMHPIRPLNRP